MKKFLILIIALLAFWSCEKEELVVKEDVNLNYVESSNPLDHVTITNNRLTFKDTKHFLNCLNVISEMSEEDLDLWEKQIGFESYRTYSNKIIRQEWEEFMKVTENGGDVSLLKDTELTDMPINYSSIANLNAEFIVGNKIIWFNKEYEYIIDNRNEILLNEIKNNYSNKNSFEGAVVHKVTKSNVEILNDDNTKSDWHDSRWQKQFKRGDHNYKFVFECWVWDLYITSTVEIRNKFEYKKGSSWKHAGEPVSHYTNVDVTCNFNTYFDAGPISSYSSNDLYYVKSTVNVYHIYVTGSMRASTNNGGKWSTTYYYDINNTIMWVNDIN